MQDEALRIDNQREVLKYITDIGASLRLGMDPDTLLKRVSDAACKALGFRYSALYIYDGEGLFQARACSGLSEEQEHYLIAHPMPEDVMTRLAGEEYKISRSYFLPSGASLWNDEYLRSFFIVVDESAETKHPSAAREAYLGSNWMDEDLLIVPLLSADNKFLGLLTPDAPLDGLRPTAETLSLFELFANQAAVVIEGTRLYEEMRRSNEERAALVEIGRMLASPEETGAPQAIYQTIYEQISRMMPVDAFYIARYLVTPEYEKLSMDYLIDDGVRYPPLEFGPIRDQTRTIILHEPVGRMLLTSKEYLAFVDVEPERADDEFIGSNRSSESLLFVPIRYGDRPLGLLSVQSYQPQAYTRRHLEFLKEVGVQAGIAMNNARLYADLREALQQAQESERLKNRFLMTASHELRTPLTAVQGYLELLGDFGETLDEEAKSRFISNARRACEELVLLLGNVMDASRIDHDRVALKMGPVQVIRAVLMILEILEPLVVREERDIMLAVAEDLYVWADDLRLRQVLLNIVGNALKYTPPGSNVAIETRSLGWEELCSRVSRPESWPPQPESDTFVVIAIRDWGSGVSPEDQPHLFTRFMRLTSAINSVQRGAGLGLYLCRQLTEAMGGTIWMESAGIEGEGSTFYIALPQYCQS